MISYIKGTLEYKGENNIVVECAGIGYDIAISGQFMNKLPAMHSQLKVFTYMYVREAELSLYGFADNEELEVFKILLGINGIGPKGAMSLLSTLTVNELRLAVVSEDKKALSKANGIGAKVAARLILELKDKLRIEDMLEAAYDDSFTAGADVNSNSNVKANVTAALMELGYSGVEAGKAVSKVQGWAEMDEEQLLKAALKNMIY